MKRLIILCSIVLLSVGLKAQSVSMNEARMAAQAFLSNQQRSVVNCAKVCAQGQDTLMYIFNTDNAFVVVSGDKRVPPILAFSDHQLYNEADIAAPAKMWLDSYQQELSALKQHADRGNVHASWQKVLSDRAVLTDTEIIAPMMKSHWGQGTNYNYYCPRDFAGENGRCVTGCVATAMAQIIYYFRFPQSGVGTYSYTDANYGVQSADYANANYRYDEMCDDPSSINLAISELIHDLGVGVDMVYGVDGSGMYNHSAARVLRTFFKYSPETEYLFRDSTTLDWDSVIVSHLQRRIPLYYAGWSTPNINGHAFICDGYREVDSCNYYHFNFGWDGSYDGHFYTDHLNLGSSHFNFAQELIINAFPDTTDYQYPIQQPATGSKLMTASAGSEQVGGDFQQCPDNMDYTWTIRPEVENLSDISFSAKCELAAGDTLYISSNDPAVADYILTQENGNANFTSNGTEIVVRLVTDATQPSASVRFNYNAHAESFCSGTHSFSSAHNSFDDGSGAENYASFSHCVYKIIVSSYSAVTLNISNFDLEENHDFLHVFDTRLGDDKLLASFTGTMPDTSIVFNYKRLALLFESDEAGTAGGFNVEYYAGFVGVEDAEVETLNFYPNPASKVLNISNDQPMNDVSVLDLMGRTLYYCNVNDTHCQLSTAYLAPGVYMLKINVDGQIISRKFIKQ